ncbi:MAG: hypothetical protein GY755_25465 [Chloroflexi bacterium]|nr:hypothetical protein [Chloroflexota bacterium]
MKFLKSKAFIPSAYFLFGLFYFFEPFLSSLFEIINPFIARNLFLPIDWMVFVITLPFNAILGFYFPDTVFIIITISYLAFFFSKPIQTGWADKQKRLAFSPLVIFPLIFLIMSPLGLFYYGQKRVNSNVVGGWTRLILAGGVDVIRADSSELLKSSNEYPADEEILASIEKLGYWTKIEQDKKILLVGVGRLFNMADEFGYIIQDDNKPLQLPDYLERSEFYRIWKFSEGIYFFEQ